MRNIFQLLKKSLFVIPFLGLATLVNAEDLKFGLPIKCELEKDCYIQNLPDLLENEDRADSFCQGATYNGHKGVDIRLLSLEDIKRNVPVIAPASGIVKALRDGAEDILAVTPEDKERVRGKECGNGIVISHEEGYESQLCHIKKNSISVQKGDRVEQGDTLGFVGTSGSSEFPHVHLSIRKNGQWIDPVSGQKPSSSCNITSTSETLFDAETIQYFSENTSRLMTSGISGNVIKHKELVRSGAPKAAVKGNEAIVGWAWFINLRKGDQIKFVLEGPQGVISENTTEPLDKHKATYSAFSGKRQKVEIGEYKLNTELLRNNEVIAQSLYVHIIE